MKVAMENLVRISRSDKDPRVPVKPSTLYKWKHTNRYPGLFVQLGGAVFIDLDRLGKIAEAGRR